MLLCSTSIPFHSCLIAPSEGSVVAYYLSEFRVPAGQQAAVDNAMSAMDKLVDKEQRTLHRPGNSLVVEDVVSSGRDKATEVQTTVVCDSVHHAVLLVVCCRISCEVLQVKYFFCFAVKILI